MNICRGIAPYDPDIIGCRCSLPGEAGSFIVHKAGLAGWTPIFYAVRSNEVSIVAELLKCGADPYFKDIAGTSVYDIAVKKGYTEITNLIGDFRPL